MTMGGDFHYQDADTWFRNLDLLIKYVNLRAAKKNMGIKLFYSTPQCYLKAVKDAEPTLPTKQDDFFPYASDGNSYWTGYFTSRPTTKYFERLANNFLQMAKHLQVLADLKESNIYVLNELKSAMGIMQHHDAITGTEKQHVAHDYERILNNAIEDSLIIPREAFNKFIQGDATKPPLFSFDVCRLNESSCRVSERSETFVVTVYNHLAWNVNESIRIPVKDGKFEVYAPNGEKIQSQLVPIPSSVINIPTRESSATHELVFIAYLKPLFYKNYYIRRTETIERQRRDEGVNEKDFNENEKVINENGNFINENGKVINENEKVINENGKVMNVNNYWNDHWKMQGNPSIEIMNIEGRDSGNYAAWNQDRPVVDREINKNEYHTLNVDVMRDARNKRRHALEVERTSNGARRSMQKSKSPLQASSPKPGQLELNEEEMRMLSDDPMVVERVSQDINWENEHLKINVDSATGDITATSKEDSTTLNLTIKYGYYIGSIGNNETPENRSSGAYILRPTRTKPHNINIQYTEVAQGPVVREVSLQTDNNIASIVRIYNGLNYMENDWVVGPIDIADGAGKEYVIDYATNMINNGEFYTDSNGRQMIKRELGKRPQWNVTISEPVAGNYYPVTNQISIKDEEMKLSILTDRSEGGTSLREGEIELMIHRRLLHDDAFGVGEALNETVLQGIGLVVRGRHRVVFGKDNKEYNIKEKKLIKQFDLQPQIFVSDAKDLSLDDWLHLKNGYSWGNELPDGLHLLTLEPWGHKKMLIRLENYLDKADKDDASITIGLNSIFKTIDVKSFKETTLAANRWIEDLGHWVWKTDGFQADDNRDERRDTNGFDVVIHPKQIRTFVVDYEFKQ